MCSLSWTHRAHWFCRPATSSLMALGTRRQWASTGPVLGLDHVRRRGGRVPWLPPYRGLYQYMIYKYITPDYVCVRSCVRACVRAYICIHWTETQTKDNNSRHKLAQPRAFVRSRYALTHTGSPASPVALRLIAHRRTPASRITLDCTGATRLIAHEL